jgi:nitroreductase
VPPRRSADTDGSPHAVSHLLQILEAARWAPTAHHMQNFEVVVVNERDLLDDIEENYAQLSLSEG